MSVIRNSEVKEHRPMLCSRHSLEFLAPLLKASVVSEIPNVRLTAGTKGYVAHFVSRNQVLLPEITGRPGKYETAEVSLLIQALHAAFAGHVPFSLAPENVWYLIAHEVAVHIRLNADRYRGYFTGSASEDSMIVRDDSLVYGSPDNG